MDNQLIKQLVKARQDLKNKYKSLKSEMAKSQIHLEKTYHPKTKPLKQLIDTIEKKEPIITKFESPSPKN